MFRYGILFFLLCVFILLGFFIANEMHIQLLQDPAFILQRGGVIAALVGIALLVADVLLPVPSSLIMIANGAMFGIWTGTLLSMIGGVLASMAGFYLGKKGAVIVNKFIPVTEQERAKVLMEKWGLLAVIITRPVPVLAESVSIIAGVVKIKNSQMLFASVAGLLPAAIIYAVTGAYSITAQSTVWSFVSVIFIGGIFWIAGRIYSGRKKNSTEPV